MCKCMNALAGDMYTKPCPQLKHASEENSEEVKELYAHLTTCSKEIKRLEHISCKYMRDIKALEEREQNLIDTLGIMARQVKLPKPAPTES